MNLVNIAKTKETPIGDIVNQNIRKMKADIELSTYAQYCSEQQMQDLKKEIYALHEVDYVEIEKQVAQRNGFNLPATDSPEEEISLKQQIKQQRFADAYGSGRGIKTNGQKMAEIFYGEGHTETSKPAKTLTVDEKHRRGLDDLLRGVFT